MTSEYAPVKTPPGVSRSSDIDKRAEALRQNLRKRKAQATKDKTQSPDAPEDQE